MTPGSTADLAERGDHAGMMYPMSTGLGVRSRTAAHPARVSQPGGASRPRRITIRPGQHMTPGGDRRRRGERQATTRPPDRPRAGGVKVKLTDRINRL